MTMSNFGVLEVIGTFLIVKRQEHPVNLILNKNRVHNVQKCHI